jgi:hypothetical protein
MRAIGLIVIVLVTRWASTGRAGHGVQLARSPPVLADRGLTACDWLDGPSSIEGGRLACFPTSRGEGKQAADGVSVGVGVGVCVRLCLCGQAQGGRLTS